MKVSLSYGPERSRSTKIVSLVCAAMFVAMLVAQLYSYENFASALTVVLPFDDEHLSKILAACIVIAELLSLPYLLSMYVSPLMRVISAAVATLVSSFWLFTCLTNAHVLNSALFSTALDLKGGFLPVIWSIALIGTLLVVVIVDSKFKHDTSS